MLVCCRWLQVDALSGQCHVIPHPDFWLRVKFPQVVSWCTGELLMERKHYVKCCKLIIADRYCLEGHFFAAESSELAIWVVSCLSQVIGIGWGW